MSSGQQQVGVESDFVCPSCKGELEYMQDEYYCAPCEKKYPVLYGIPDFRLRSDRYLTLEQERDKARRLYEFAQTASFDEVLAYYYEITDDVPPELAKRYQAYVHNAPTQASGLLDQLAPETSTDSLLDLGCGAGGLLLASNQRFKKVVGVDIALRWLVICNKRLQELGIKATLVCADAEQLPFREAGFTHVVAADLVEHVYDIEATIQQIYRQLVPGGCCWLSATNRYCIGPHPTTRIWGIGYFPLVMRTTILQWLRGVDSLRFINLVSAFSMKRFCRRAGFIIRRVGPKQLYFDDISAYPKQDRVLIRGYQLALKFLPFRALLTYIGPAFEVVCEKKHS